MDKPVKLLVATAFSDRSEIALYSRLAYAGIRVEVACHPSAPEISNLRNNGIAVSPIEIRHRLDFRAVRELRSIIRQSLPDIVLAPLNSSLSVSLMASFGLKPKIVGYRGTLGHLSRLDPACWLTYFNPRVDMIICVSEAVRKYLLSLRLPEQRLAAIYKGHDPSWYKPAERSALAVFGIPENSFVAGFAGTMRPVKGVDLLIRSMKEACASSPAHLLLAGKVLDPYIYRLARQSKAKDRIHFAGFRKDAAALMGACDVFVMPSRAREGLPRAVIEAMSQGVPAVVTDVGGMPEIVQDGVSGLVVPPGNIHALSKAILRLKSSSEERMSMGRNARRQIEENFNISRTVEKMLELLNRLVH